VQLVSKIFNLCGHDPPTLQTDGQTDRQMACDSKTALCTIDYSASRGKKWLKSEHTQLVKVIVWIDNGIEVQVCSVQNSFRTGAIVNRRHQIATALHVSNNVTVRLLRTQAFMQSSQLQFVQRHFACVKSINTI